MPDTLLSALRPKPLGGSAGATRRVHNKLCGPRLTRSVAPGSASHRRGGRLGGGKQRRVEAGGQGQLITGAVRIVAGAGEDRHVIVRGPGSHDLLVLGQGLVVTPEHA